MTITIRSARIDDAPFLAWVMLTATRSHLEYGLWDHFVNQTESDCLLFLETIAQTKIPHLFHHRVFRVAEQNGQPIAALSGYDPETEGMPAFLKALPEVFEKLGWAEAQQKAAFVRSMPYVACTPEDAPGAWIIESVAAQPEFRRQGVVTLLLEDIIARGKASGFERAQISVFIGNIPARRAYQKCGFQFVDEKRVPEFETIYKDPGLAHLILEFD